MPAIPSHSPLSAPEALEVCKRFVYPPCKKLGGLIRLNDRIQEDLGYRGNETFFLAVRTNEAFQLSGRDGFSSLDFSQIPTVEDHLAAICSRLQRAGRLDHNA